jgi:ABC-2 type transport system ATP-binding protein
VAGVRPRASVGPRHGGPGASLNTIVTRKLTKRYGDLAAVDALDLTIEPGSLYGFLGPNGAGKTTTIRMILGLIFPTSGDAEVLGEPIFGGTASQRASALRRVGAMIEEPAFWGYLSGRKNLEYFARAAGPQADREGRLRRIDEVMRIVGLDQAANKKVKAYSQGMRQRLGIALALSGSPDLLVLDEPTNGLDPQGMREIRRLLRRLADDGTTIFVSSHLLAEVEAMCDRVGVLARGKLVAEGPPSKLRAGADVVRVEVDDPERARRILSGVEGVTLDGAEDSARTLRVRLAAPASAAEVNSALVSGGVAVSALVPEHESLEDVFVSLVEGADVPR